MKDFTLVRGANVAVTKIRTGDRINAEVTINDQYVHRFSAKSRVSKHLDVMTPEDLQERLQGGSFFFIEDELVDFRDGQYNGFIHTDETIGVFMEVLGAQRRKDIPLHRRKRNADSDSDIILRKVWDDQEIIVPGYAQGNEFSSRLSFLWNPYVKTINSSFDLTREICTNGMIGLTSFLNTKIPLVNRWHEHLDIGCRQIQNKVTSTVLARIQSMERERASVGDCLLLEQHAFDRLNGPTGASLTERQRIMSLMTAVSPKAHLSGVYRDDVFQQKALAQQLPSHLTTLDIFNIATELRTHVAESKKSSDHALDRMANHMLFDYDTNVTASASRFSGPRLASFSSPERAFFGEMN